jgi:hypothetical protein
VESPGRDLREKLPRRRLEKLKLSVEVPKPGPASCSGVSPVQVCLHLCYKEDILCVGSVAHLQMVGALLNLP